MEVGCGLRFNPRSVYKESRTPMNEARLSHLPFWGPNEAVLILFKRPSG